MEIENPFGDATDITRNQAEFRLQVAVVNHLKSAFKEVIWTAFPGRPGNAKDGFMKKAMGVKPGVPDLLFWWQYPCAVDKKLIQCAGIELKSAKGKISPDQNRFASYFTAIGGKFACCNTVRQVHDALKNWGLRPTHESIVEPDTRSDMKKKADMFNWYKPL